MIIQSLSWSLVLPKIPLKAFVSQSYHTATSSSHTALFCTATDKVTKKKMPCPDCDKCDGSGRILGGLASIPLTSWWPIKAYR